MRPAARHDGKSVDSRVTGGRSKTRPPTKAASGLSQRAQGPGLGQHALTKRPGIQDAVARQIDNA